ncbi:primosomal protein N' [bacterium AH-315-C07]|nr:primosomal protein N' [bacterium AH-315-C07]
MDKQIVSDTPVTLFVNVILPLALPNTYTYQVPKELEPEIKIGKRVIVQFGKHKFYTALIAVVTDQSPSIYDAKNVQSVIDEHPIVSEKHIQFWKWIADYYMCNLGEVMNCALPSSFKLSSETVVRLNDDFDLDKCDAELSDKEFLIVEALEINRELSLKDIASVIDRKNVYTHLQRLIETGTVIVEEELKEKYKPRIESYIELHENYKSEDAIQQLFDELEKAPKQLDALMLYLHLNRTSLDESKYENLYAIRKKRLTGEKVTSGIITALIKKEVFVSVDREVGRIAAREKVDDIDITLSGSQTKTLDSIKSSDPEKCTLLHGVTSSGKTQVYIKLIEEVLQEGKQTLYLLPEIALTTQIVQRLQQHFGSEVGVYHSRFNSNERVEIWNKVLNKEYKVVLGARSSMFLPFKDLGLIIVDEEHETTFKQFEPAPRYNARDSAIYLGQLFKCKVVLGTATPSFESYYNALQGKYDYVPLTERYGGVSMPQIKVVNIKEEKRKKKMNSHFSSVLLHEIEAALEKNEQVILFQNRRGYVPFLECNMCGYVPQCVHCDVSMTHHKFEKKLRCHYCGYKQDPFLLCPACGSNNIQQQGFGTEKIEDELKPIFKNKVIARLDLDSTRGKHGFQKILSDFEDRSIDILVGTQMITKGLDFDNVSLVGILSSDSLLNYPDFRAFEHAYQLMAQVSGRAGRKKKQGQVLIQAYNPEHPVIKYVVKNDYHGMFNKLIKERHEFNYPPYQRLIKLTLKHRDISELNKIAYRLKIKLDQKFKGRVLGPEFPPVKRVRSLYLKHLLIKFPRDNSLIRNKEILKSILDEFQADKENRRARLIVDVDPG